MRFAGSGLPLHDAEGMLASRICESLQNGLFVRLAKLCRISASNVKTFHRRMCREEDGVVPLECLCYEDAMLELDLWELAPTPGKAARIREETLAKLLN